MKVINTKKAPGALGPYVQAIKAGDFLIVSGQIPIDPKIGTIVEDDIETQTRQSLENLKAIINEAGCTLKDVVRCGVFLKDMDNFTKMNAIYAEYFSTHKPTRACVEVARLPKDVMVEIEAMVYCGDKCCNTNECCDTKKSECCDAKKSECCDTKKCCE